MPEDEFEHDEYFYEEGLEPFNNSPRLEPEILTFRIGGGLGPSYEIRWSPEKRRLIAEGTNMEPAEVEVSAAQWRTFWFVVDGLNVWAWKRSHSPDNTVCDGTQWGLRLADGRRRVASCGSNAYPGGYDEDEESSPFNTFLAAVNMLLGRDDIA
jgi:hypothetical protein